MLAKLVCLFALVGAQYKKKIEPFSFNIANYEYPLDFKQYGATIALKDTIKLLPKVADRYGNLFLDEVS